jgi:hypothetical protein
MTVDRMLTGVNLPQAEDAFELDVQVIDTTA